MNEVKKFESQVGTLKLSEAIRIGAKLRPQNRSGNLFHAGTSCALGAAIEVVLGITSEVAGDDLENRLFRACGVPSEHFKLVYWGVVGRNDEGATREECADYVESLGY